ncbi:MaoC family dehydratase [Bradyrhizobium sp. KB893862 SZCCT0404]|uniref:MaoC family dehydratase n=1 Tax=Bradyrhizobium sp. KB893862 SZCCT0404 TaxID=2807672 RepID=UPI001BAE0214|nr:MaoC family dehydratase [Bradyrhizobium sp. KB893862 SZCCT0404]MBR1172753.1 MaoC family dehydratase [Bradyrhizobium sp. KB893862 SZCCT0404]
MAKVTLAAIRDFIGRDLGRSGWVTVDQSMIDQFAACTGDRQWIHVDADRASKESAAGGTIAHGFLSLSLIAPLSMNLGLVPVDASAVFNYGLDKVRFLTPVKSGSRVRLQLSLTGVEPKDNGRLLIKGNAVIEIENSEKPALVAETLTLVVP